MVPQIYRYVLVRPPKLTYLVTTPHIKLSSAIESCQNMIIMAGGPHIDPVLLPKLYKILRARPVSYSGPFNKETLYLHEKEAQDSVFEWYPEERLPNSPPDTGIIASVGYGYFTPINMYAYGTRIKSLRDWYYEITRTEEIPLERIFRV